MDHLRVRSCVWYLRLVSLAHRWLYIQYTHIYACIECYSVWRILDKITKLFMSRMYDSEAFFVKRKEIFQRVAPPKTFRRTYNQRRRIISSLFFAIVCNEEPESLSFGPFDCLKMGQFFISIFFLKEDDGRKNADAILIHLSCFTAFMLLMYVCIFVQSSKKI